MTKVLGMDISLNHGAVVELSDGKLVDFAYYTTLVGSANASPRGTRIEPGIFKIKDKQYVGVARADWIEEYLAGLLNNKKPDYVGLEDYAYGAEQGAHQLGEVGGLVRLACWRLGTKLRLHDPISTKMFVAHDGTSQKDAVQRAVEKRWGIDFSPVDQPMPKATEKRPDPTQNKQTSEDLADAFAIAQLVWTEIQLRSGSVVMSQLHEKEVRVFNRITKTYPINLLSREWVCNPKGKIYEDELVAKRFFEKVDKDGPNGCWNWTASCKGGGYGQIAISGKGKVSTHRYSYEYHKGLIPNGLFVCHSCDNPCCVNPEHLWLGTHKENMEDCVRKGRHKKRGSKNGNR